MLRKIEQCFNEIWRLQDRRSLFQRIRDYLSVLMVGPFLLFLSMAMTAALRHANVVAGWLNIDLENGHLGFIFNSIPYLLFMLAFTALYMFMPNTKVEPGPALAAGLITGIIWKVLGKIFAIFVTGTSNYAVIYSAFAAMVLFMIWIYIGWMTVLVGAAICYYLQHPSNQSVSRNFRSLSLRLKEKLALQVCVEVGQALYHRRPPLDVTGLAGHIGVPSLAVDNVARSLIQMGILARTGRDAQSFIPARPFDDTSVEDMLKALRAADETGVLQVHKLRAAAAVNTVLKIHDKAIHRDLGKITLKQLALGSIET
jgi:membrane protein